MSEPRTRGQRWLFDARYGPLVFDIAYMTKALPGHPDIVFPAKRIVVLVHGCFWHGHEG